VSEAERRDLAGAIHEQIKSPESVAKALDIWQHRKIGRTDLADMWFVLATISEDAIEAVLAKEATGE
jgi:hypothetical protein